MSGLIVVHALHVCTEVQEWSVRASLSEVAEDGLHQAHNYAHAAIILDAVPSLPQVFYLQNIAKGRCDTSQELD